MVTGLELCSILFTFTLVVVLFSHGNYTVICVVHSALLFAHC